MSTKGTSSTAPTADELLRHADFLRSLARAILGDDHRAEDAVQDAFSVALTTPPRLGGNLRGWLTGVTKNLARMRARSDARRAARERSAAVGTGTDPAEVAERLETQRRLVTEVVALDEPYRTTIVLRFFDGLSPAEIARRQAVPVKTVHTRIRRAILRLRDQLEADRRPRATRALLAIARGVVVTSTKKVTIAAVLAALLLAGGVYLAVGPRRAGPAPPAPSVSHAPGVSAAAPANGSGPAPAHPATPGTADPDAEWTLRVRVERSEDSPVPGADVFVLSADGRRIAEAKTDRQGRAELPIRGKGRVGVIPGSGTPRLLRDLAPPPGGAKSVTVRIDHRAGISGVVLDFRGEPVPRGPERYEYVTVRAVSLEEKPWYGDWRGAWSDVTDREGRFRIRDLPEGRYRIEVVERKDPSAGRPPAEPVVAETGDGHVTIRLDPPLGLRLRLVDAETGESIDTGTTRIALLDAEDRKITETIWTTCKGDVPLWDLPGERIRIAIQAEGYLRKGPLEVIAAPGSPPRSVTIPLEPAMENLAVVRLRVTDTAGNPVERLRLGKVLVVGDPERNNTVRNMRDRTAPDGRLEIELAPGTHEYDVEVPDSDADPVHLVFRVGPGDRVDQEVVLGATGRVRIVTHREG